MATGQNRRTRAGSYTLCSGFLSSVFAFVFLANDNLNDASTAGRGLFALDAVGNVAAAIMDSLNVHH